MGELLLTFQKQEYFPFRLYSALWVLLFCCSTMILSGCEGPVSEPQAKERNPNAPEVEESTYDGMLYISPSHGSYLLGETQSVSFSSGYHLDQYEVTTEQFKNLMGYLPEGLSSDQKPIRQVNWYEAAVYCNQKSKELGLDTLYRYSNIVRNSSDQIDRLDDFHIPQGIGVRLVTESEWEHAAFYNQLEDLNESAWHNQNSNGKAKTVGTKSPGKLGFYDLQGNVKEWVHDWKGPLVDTSVTNYSGYLTPNALNERVVKGGSFTHDLEALNIYQRGDVYSVSSGTRTEYIGFRCAIAESHEMNSLDHIKNDDVELAKTVVDYTEAYQFLNAHSKLAYINRESEQLEWIDFTKEPITKHSHQFGFPVFHPSLSPDGRFIAVSTSIEGSNEYSQVIVINVYTQKTYDLPAPTASIPRWFQDEEGTYIHYVDRATSNEDETWNSGSTWQISFEMGEWGSPKQLTSGGSYSGGVDSTGQIFASGYTQLLTYNNGKSQLLFQSPKNGKEPEESTQVCNVSMNPGSDPELLFLDFGYQGQSGLTGDAYGIHEVIFRSDENGNISQWYFAPPEEKGWDHTEWSNHPDYAVSSATNSDERSHAIYMINLKDSSYLKAVQDDKVWHPSLWIHPHEGDWDDFDLDSLGNYDDPVEDNSQDLFAYKMHHFWSQTDLIEGMILGSSRANMGVNPEQLSQGRFFNLANPQSDLAHVENLYFNYVTQHVPELKTVILGLDPDLMFTAQDGLIKLLAQSHGFKYDRSHDFWKDGLPPNHQSLFTQAEVNHELSLDYTEYGFPYTFECSGWGEEPTQEGRIDWGADDLIYLDNIQRIRNILEDTQLRGIKVLGIVFPQHPDYPQTSHWGKFGPQPETAAAILEDLQDFASEFDGFQLLDLNQDGSHDFGDESAHDSDHLCVVGASKVTHMVDSILGL